MRPSSPLFLTLRLLADTGLLVKVAIKESIAAEENDRLSQEEHHICSLSSLPPPPCLHTLACLTPSGSVPLGERPGFRPQRSLPLQSSPLSAICAVWSPFSVFCGLWAPAALTGLFCFCWTNELGHVSPSLQLQSPAQSWPGRWRRLSQCLDSEY